MTRLIDADVLIENIIKSIPDLRKFSTKTVGEVIDNTPTVDAVPVRHGKWTVTPVYIKCSECGESFMLIPQNYCPNCGARMDAEREEE